MKKLLILVMGLYLAAPSIAQIKFHNLMFTPHQTTLTDEQKTELRELAIATQYNKKVIVYPLTYDSIHQRKVYAKEARIQGAAIANYAKTIGFKLLGNPENFPSGFRGRSVSVNLKYLGPPKAKGLQDYYPEKPSQFFVIDPTRDTILEGNEGTRMLFRAGCMMAKEPVRIELKEYYGIGDYMKSGLATISNGKMIETGGSIYLDAVKNDNPKQKVKVNPNQGIGLDFTLGKDDEEMQVFIKDPNSKETNWILPNSNGERQTSSWEMTETFLDENGKVISKKTYNKEEWEAKKKKEEEERIAREKAEEEERIAREKAEEERRIAMEKENEERRIAMEKTEKARTAMNSALQTTNLGYINCDKFISEPMMRYVFKSSQDEGATYYLVYSDVRGVMQGYVNGSKVEFGSVPRNRPARLIAIAFVDDKPLYYEKEIIAGNAPPTDINLVPITKKELDKRLIAIK